MGLFRRLLPQLQSSVCDGCLTPIVERRRKPCPHCGSINRIISRRLVEHLRALDRLTG